MATHKLYGGSRIHRIVGCPGSVQAEGKAPKFDDSNVHAQRGSALHAAAEIVLNTGKPTAEFLNWHCVEHDYTLTDGDVDDLETALQAVNEVLDRYQCTEIVTEAFVEYSTDIGGSADVIACGDEYVVIADFKFGMGFVDVAANKQLALYAMSAMNTPAVADMFAGKRLVGCVVQPKLNTEATTYEYAAEEFDALCREMLGAIELSQRPDAPLYTGAHCKFCKAAPYCPAKRTQAMTFLRLSPTHAQELAQAMELVEQIKEHIKAVEAEVFRALENDEKVPGWKLVEKQKRRYWTDPEAVELMLRKANIPETSFMESSLLSVAQLEKSLKKVGREINLEKYVDNKSSGVTIAPETDKRPAVPGKNLMPESLALIMKQTN